MKGKWNYITSAVVIVIILMIYNAVNTPGVNDLKGNFKENAFVRNEQNSGPVVRLYTVGVDGEQWTEMEKYGNYMPHTKYGTTRVYFFLNSGEIPKSLDIEQGLDERYKATCIAVYEKDGMSQVSLTRYPFR